ncbi:putative bifunctional diguanylate cyclase/phosphodiesterase [Alteromonas oceanisediminis]|uniref:putative bifunctional diguanylate cyclase/phosphodiesterase n=1 Tax=Alteromonas oceanisediminis TaxID=2836180 RepID=UPI001BDA1600|nr:bifunctional diguanylate cyclase/phosphodiesterase [Alteromonas oceanisediminis]MBT0587306.1 bifunctional diguanylate cyclase/phosphodiesterase [Alteromonas oceanisediminis]
MSRVHHNLSAIPNRYAFIHCIERLAEESDAISLLLIDVVRFSDVTTSYGMHIGDEFLLSIANRIALLFRESASIGRLSGDVFGVLFDCQLTAQEQNQKFEHLVEHFKTPIQHDGNAFIADFNVGAVSSSSADFKLTDFIARAEAALKQAKQNKYENFSTSDVRKQTRTSRTLTLKADLQRALVQNELELYFQPKVDLQTLEIIGAECLLRWNHPLDGILFPGPLIEAAESYNMMNELGYWTLENAFIHMRKFLMVGLDIVLSVNISPTQLYDSQLVNNLLLFAKTYELPLNRFELELTEDVALSNSLMVKGQLDALRNLGLSISIDDFGKGYSNLSYIRALNIDTLKIDKTFTLDIDQAAVNRAIIQAVKIIGDAKECKVIAEGIETLSHLHVLREIGIPQGQGYLFTKALPANEFIAFSQTDIIIGTSALHKTAG